MSQIGGDGNHLVQGRPCMYHKTVTGPICDRNYTTKLSSVLATDLGIKVTGGSFKLSSMPDVYHHELSIHKSSLTVN